MSAGRATKLERWGHHWVLFRSPCRLAVPRIPGALSFGHGFVDQASQSVLVWAPSLAVTCVAAVRSQMELQPLQVTRRVPHVVAAGAGCWLLGWAGDQSACSWPHQHGPLRAVKPPTGCLALPKSGVPGGQGRSCMTFREITSKVTQHTSSLL